MAREETDPRRLSPNLLVGAIRPVTLPREKFHWAQSVPELTRSTTCSEVEPRVGWKYPSRTPLMLEDFDGAFILRLQFEFRIYEEGCKSRDRGRNIAASFFGG
jgi:hypothetical protein